MSIREKIAKSPVVGIVIGIVLFAAAGIVMFQTVFASNSGKLQAMYSDDDGKTWFKDELRKLPPFDHHGKTAYRVQVFKCGKDAPFVAWLETYSEDDKRTLAAAGSDDIALAAAMQSAQPKIKRPGEASWVGSENRQKYEDIMTPKCPGGSTDKPQQVGFGG